MSGAANRARGARAEVAVVNYLRGRGWPDARRYLAGDGRQPGDIDVWPGISIEVKDRKRSAWPTWCEQAVDEAGVGRVPVVVRRTRGVSDVALWEARVRVRDYRHLSGQPMVAGTPRNFVECPRTHANWVRMTFGAVADLVAADQAVTS